MSNELAEKEVKTIVVTTPADLLNMAVSKGADMDQLSKLMDLQERWEANEAKKAYVRAMSKFRSDCPAIQKTREAHNSKYAGLAETISGIKDHLSANGLTHSWKTSQEGKTITVSCCVTHDMGHSECTSLSGEPDTTGSKNAIQGMGSTVSYLERYTLYAILGLASGDMDDNGGNAEEIERITEDQANELHARASENGVLDGFIKFLESTKCYAIADIRADDYERVSKKLNISIEASKEKDNGK